MIHLSRSAISAYLNCRTQYYYNYLFNGTGIVPVTASLPLSTGIHVHLGAQCILTNWLEFGEEYVEQYLEDLVDNAVKTVKKAMLKDVTNNIHGKGVDSPEAQKFISIEQIYLTEALIRLWATWELPTLLANYTIVSCEQDMAVLLSQDITFTGRVDAILETKDGKDIYNYNIKTSKQWTPKSNNAFSVDLQSLTEMAIVNSNFKAAGKDTRVRGTRFCFLIKGKRETDPITGFLKTANPFIQGYKLPSATGIDYAYSYWYTNPEGGNSRLGNKWIKFNVWDKDTGYPGGVKQWIWDIAANKLQEGLNVSEFFDRWCVTPVKYRTDAEVKLAVQQVKHLAFEIQANIKYPGVSPIPVVWTQNRDSCYWPEDCDYLPICHGRVPFKDEKIPIVTDPLNSGLYQIRVPHHDES